MKLHCHRQQKYPLTEANYVIDLCSVPVWERDEVAWSADGAWQPINCHQCHMKY